MIDLTPYQIKQIEKLAPPLRKIFVEEYARKGFQLYWVKDYGTEGLARTKHHKQASLTTFRYPPDISRFGYYGAYACDLTTPPGDDHQCWARHGEGGLIFPPDSEYAFFGCTFAMRAFANSSMYTFVTGLDTQRGPESDDWRYWVRLRAQISDGESNLVYRLQYSSVGVDTPVWADVVDSRGNVVTFNMPWNEPRKPMTGYIAALYNVVTHSIERVYINNETFKTNLVISSGTELAEFPDGLIRMEWIENFPAAATQAGASQTALIESPFLALL